MNASRHTHNTQDFHKDFIPGVLYSEILSYQVKILKSHLAAKCTMWKDYWAHFREILSGVLYSEIVSYHVDILKSQVYTLVSSYYVHFPQKSH